MENSADLDQLASDGILDLDCCYKFTYLMENSADLDQLASSEDLNLHYFQKPTDLNLHCFPLSMWIYSNNPDQVFRLAEK